MTRLLTKKVPYTFNRAGYYYFSRRVPSDLLRHYSYPRIVQGLKTRSAQTAKSRALVAAAKLDEYWSHLRMADPDLIGRSLLRQGYGSFARNTQLDVSTGTEQPITLSEALETYVTQKGAGKPKTFHAAAQRACSYLVDAFIRLFSGSLSGSLPCAKNCSRMNSVSTTASIIRCET